MHTNNTITICGAGIAGIATAYYLLKKDRNTQIILIDKNQPLSFTTSKSGENYRDYWPEENMRSFISDSILLMKELKLKYEDASFDMINSGYNFVSHNSEKKVFDTNLLSDSKKYFEEITDNNVIQNNHSYLDKNIKKIVTVKNAGRIDVYALGSLLLREAKKMGLKQIEGEILDINKKDSSFNITLNSKQTIKTSKIVIAAGPFINNIAKMLGFQFPISNTLQRKFIIPDPKKIIPKNMPFTIYADSQFLNWSNDEIDFFSSDQKYKWLLNKFPGGLHIKPDSEGIKLGWAFQTEHTKATWSIPKMDLFPQVVLKGASNFIPELSEYENNIPSPLIEYAGHYTRTKENWPLIGPAKEKNIFVIGALAGYGTMASCAAGKLCATYILKETKLPKYAKYFHPQRYEDTVILKEISKINNDGQL